MKNLVILLCTLCCMLTPAAAEELSQFETELLQHQITSSKAALNLSPEQEEAFSEVLQSAAKLRQRTLQKYDISMGDEKKATLSFIDKRALMKDMQKLKSQLEEQLADVLTAKQLRIFLSMQEENQQAFKTRLRNKLN